MKLQSTGLDGLGFLPWYGYKMVEPLRTGGICSRKAFGALVIFRNRCLGDPPDRGYFNAQQFCDTVLIEVRTCDMIVEIRQYPVNNDEILRTVRCTPYFDPVFQHHEREQVERLGQDGNVAYRSSSKGRYCSTVVIGVPSN